MSNVKLNNDLRWNVAGFAVLGISGIAINILIARYYGTATLGVFNQALAFYIVISQLAVLGIHFAVLKFVAEQTDNSQNSDQIISAALLLTVVNASLWIGLFYCISAPLLAVFNSADLVVAFYAVLPGIWLFSVNKVLINVVNAMHHMRAFAILQNLRYLAILSGIVAAIAFDVDGNALAWSITLSEVVVLVVMLTYLHFGMSVKWVIPSMSWLKSVFLFGVKGSLVGVMSELNSRIDVIMLGLMSSDSVVGIYSMAAMIAEGLVQLLAVARNILNPIIARTMHVRQPEALQNLQRLLVQWRNKVYVAMTVVIAVAIIFYPYLSALLIGHGDFADSYGVFILLSLGILLACGYLPMELFFIMAGAPKLQTLFKTALVMVNIVLNALLIPWLGAYGAALSTGLVYIFTGLLIKWYCRDKFNIIV